MSDNADRGYRYSVEEAEKLTGITCQQASKWGAALKDVKKYRAKQLSKAYQAALARADVT